MDLGLSHIGLTDSDEERFKALMVEVIAKSASRHRWNFVEPERAELVIVSAESTEGLELVARNNADRQRLIAVLAGESDRLPPGCERLAWPMRIGNLISLLMRAELHAERNRAQPKKIENGTLANSPLNKLALILLNGTGVLGPQTVWRVEGLQPRPVYLVPQQGTFLYPGPVTTIRNLDLAVDLTFEKLPIGDLPDRDVSRPIAILQWEIGQLCGQLGLFPWIEKTAVFQLKRFPEFAILHHTPAHRRLAAFLSRPRRGVEVIQKVSNIDAPVITGFINAANLCGYMKAVPAKPVKKSTTSGALAPRRALFGSIRKALGIAINNG